MASGNLEPRHQWTNDVKILINNTPVMLPKPVKVSKKKGGGTMDVFAHVTTLCNIGPNSISISSPSFQVTRYQ